MLLQLRNYHMANEILYALSAAKKTSVGHLSRLTLQKVLYLSGALAPLKDIALVYIRFNAANLGPYERRIQNTIDHLVGIGLADVIYFDKTKMGGALTNYIITDIGTEVVDRLIKYPNEEEKAWWVSLVTSMVYSYLVSAGLRGTVDDKVRSIVYQDPTYKPYRKEKVYKRLIDLSVANGLTYQFVEFLKEYTKRDNAFSSEFDERKKVAIMLVTFMEYLYTGVLNEARA